MSERLHEGDAIAERIVRHQVEVGGDDGAEILAERDVDRGAIVECPNADVQHLPADLQASLVRRSTRSGCRAPSGSTPVPLVAIRTRSAERRSTIRRYASKTAATRIEPRAWTCVVEA